MRVVHSYRVFWLHGCKAIDRKDAIMDTDKIYAERIASEYAPKDALKVVALRKLDARAKLPATVFGYAFGIASALLLGVGMCLTMGVLGDAESPMLFSLGVAVGILGIAGAAANYPLYRRMLAQGKQRYASDIVLLAQEISAS